MDNHKRIYRIYKEEGLQVRKRPRKRARTQRSFKLQVSEGPNQRWSLDFMHDSTSSGRKLRILNVVDDYTREALWMEVSTSISGQHVTRVLDRLIELRGKPKPTDRQRARVRGNRTRCLGLRKENQPSVYPAG